jgi:hypothetical protein
MNGDVFGGMTADIVAGLCLIVAGVRVLYRRRRIASESAGRYEPWMVNRPDPNVLEGQLAVLAWILVGMGVLVLILHAASS